MSHALTSRQRNIKAATVVDLGVLYSTISAGMLLVRRYLTGRGIDQEFADRYGSAFGRTAAKIYRTSNGAEPRRAWSNVSGKWRRVNGYLPVEAEILDEAFATYRRTAEYIAPQSAPEIFPADAYLAAAGDMPAAFEKVTGELLREVERRDGSEAVTDFVTERIDDLQRWQRAVDRYAETMTNDVGQAARTAVPGLAWDDPRQQTWMKAERGAEDVLAAREGLNAAYVDWAFDLAGTVEVPDVPRPSAPVIPEGCRIPSCDGTWHYDATCTAQLGEVQFQGEDVSLPAELVADESGPYIVAFAYNMTSLNIRREMRDRPAAYAFAAQLRRLADAIDDASAHLPA
ncbi:hypothetical protein [Streptomyces phaeoluteigriseus]|uniref:hypothetical protein n=1 Tax=Streptomyces phaeoluteigriseus TaxID=114686 RepID=UPI0036CD54E9